MTFIKSIKLLTVFLLVFTFSFGTVLAQENVSEVRYNDEGEILVEDDDNSTVYDDKTASVVVQGLNINSESYREGDVISGSFVINNNGDYFAQDITYSISVVSDYEIGVAKRVHTVKDYGEYYSLSSGEQEKVSFAYEIPKILSGEYGLQIGLSYKSGSPLAWQDALFTYTNVSLNESVDIDITYALLYKGEETFYLDLGPTFEKDEQPVLRVEVTNYADQEVNIYPVVEYARFDSSDNYYGKEILEPLTISANNSIDTRINLSKHNNDSGVYTAKTYFSDENGNALTPSIFTKYIIAGGIVTVYQLQSDLSYLKKGDSFNLKLDYVGTPLDLTGIQDTEPNIYEGRLDITVYNQDREVVATYSGKYNNLDSRQEMNISLVAEKDAELLYAEAKFYDEQGQLVQNYTTEEINHSEKPEGLSLLQILSIILGIIIVIVIMYLIYRNKKMNKITNTIGTLVLALIAGFSFSMFTNVDNVDAVVIYNNGEVKIEWWNTNSNNRCRDRLGNTIYCAAWGSSPENYNLHDVIPNITVNSPSYSGLKAGSTYTFSGYQLHDACSNSAPQNHIYLKNNPSSNLVTSGERVYYRDSFINQGWKDGAQHWYNAKGNFNFQMSIPSTPGVHDKRLRFTVCNYNDYTKCGYKEITVRYTIPQPPTPAQCGPADGGVYSSWENAESDGLCSVGTVDNQSFNAETNTGNWRCNAGGDNVAWCSATYVDPNTVVAPQCGTDDGETFASNVTPTNLCSVGTASSVQSNDILYSWTCLNDSLTEQCSATRQCPSGESPCLGNCVPDGTCNVGNPGTTPGTTTGTPTSCNPDTQFFCDGACMNNTNQDQCTSPDPEIIDFSPNPRIIDEGGTCELSWTVENSTSCQLSANGQDIGEPYTPSESYMGQITIPGLTNTTSYTLTCSNEGGGSPASDTTSCIVDLKINQN